MSLKKFKKDLILYYWKAVIYIVVGLISLVVGIFLTVMHFLYEAELDSLADVSRKPYFISGPIATSAGIMLMTIGIVWIGIIKEKNEKMLLSPSTSKQNAGNGTV